MLDSDLRCGVINPGCGVFAETPVKRLSPRGESWKKECCIVERVSAVIALVLKKGQQSAEPRAVIMLCAVNSPGQWGLQPWVLPQYHDMGRVERTRDCLVVICPCVGW